MKYHLSALFTITIWSLSYISTKVLLGVLSPIEISLYRFIIGYLVLLALKPPKKIKLNIKEDKNLIISGFLGVFLYYIVENSATKHTQASNVSIIVSTIPLITSILAHYINRDEKFRRSNIITFIISFSGVVLVILEGSSINGGLPLGNLLALLGAIVFSFYNIFIRRIPKVGDSVTRGRKINLYGLFFIVLLYLFIPDKSSPLALIESRYLLNLLFLGTMASGLCVFLWSYSITGLGSVVTSRYIYLAPLITGIASYFLLGEPITLKKGLGMALILGGMLFPEIIKKKQASY